MPTSVPTNSGKPFCEVSSVAPHHSSNLQLFSLQQAYQYWYELQEAKPRLTSHQITEYLAFIVVCSGTSLSQLLGQNANHPKEHIDSPKKLFLRVFGSGHPKWSEFDAFNRLYDDCRHFGFPKYPSVISLTEEDCHKHLELVVALWDEIVKRYCDEGNDSDQLLAEFESVSDFV